MSRAAFDVHSAQRSGRGGTTLYAGCVAVLLDPTPAGAWQYVGAYASTVRLYCSASGARKAAAKLAAMLDLRAAAEHCEARREETARRIAAR